MLGLARLGSQRLWLACVQFLYFVKKCSVSSDANSVVGTLAFSYAIRFLMIEHRGLGHVAL